MGTTNKGKGKEKTKAKPDEVPPTEAGPSMLDKIDGAEKSEDDEALADLRQTPVKGKGAAAGGAAEVQVQYTDCMNNLSAQPYFFMTMKFVLQTKSKSTGKESSKNRKNRQSGLPAASGKAATQVRLLGAGSVLCISSTYICFRRKQVRYPKPRNRSR